MGNRAKKHPKLFAVSHEVADAIYDIFQDRGWGVCVPAPYKEFPISFQHWLRNNRKVGLAALYTKHILPRDQLTAEAAQSLYSSFYGPAYSTYISSDLFRSK